MEKGIEGTAPPDRPAFDQRDDLRSMRLAVSLATILGGARDELNSMKPVFWLPVSR
ncbi:MAG: hypothetical protein PHY45_13050 [Rhodocyclaceae bacterium]|nr:hypothetical protein [Rhodocyclaceae bacterium]